MQRNQPFSVGFACWDMEPLTPTKSRGGLPNGKKRRRILSQAFESKKGVPSDVP
jgi:hypothetical protein